MPYVYMQAPSPLFGFRRADAASTDFRLIISSGSWNAEPSVRGTRKAEIVLGGMVTGIFDLGRSPAKFRGVSKVILIPQVTVYITWAMTYFLGLFCSEGVESSKWNDQGCWWKVGSINSRAEANILREKRELSCGHSLHDLVWCCTGTKL